MRLTILVVALLAVHALGETSKLEEGKTYLNKMSVCRKLKDKDCFNKAFKKFKKDTELRLRTLYMEEEVRAAEYGSRFAKKCSLLKGDSRSKCLKTIREKEVRRKGKIMVRLAKRKGGIGAKMCSKLKTDVARRECRHAVKKEMKKEVARIKRNIVDLVSDYSLADIEGEAQFFHLVPKSEECRSVQCQRDIVRDECPISGKKRKQCERMVLQVPLNVGDNVYLARIRDDVARCTTDFCRNTRFERFRVETESQVRILARYKARRVLATFYNKLKGCNGNAACEDKHYFKSLKYAIKAQKMVASMNSHIAARRCDGIVDDSKRHQCSRVAKKERKRFLKSMKKRMKRSLKRVKKLLKKRTAAMKQKKAGFTWPSEKSEEEETKRSEESEEEETKRDTEEGLKVVQELKDLGKKEEEELNGEQKKKTPSEEPKKVKEETKKPEGDSPAEKQIKDLEEAEKKLESSEKEVVAQEKKEEAAKKERKDKKETEAAEKAVERLEKKKQELELLEQKEKQEAEEQKEQEKERKEEVEKLAKEEEEEAEAQKEAQMKEEELAQKKEEEKRKEKTEAEKKILLMLEKKEKEEVDAQKEAEKKELEILAKKSEKQKEEAEKQNNAEAKEEKLRELEGQKQMLEELEKTAVESLTEKEEEKKKEEKKEKETEKKEKKEQKEETKEPKEETKEPKEEISVPTNSNWRFDEQKNLKIAKDVVKYDLKHLSNKLSEFKGKVAKDKKQKKEKKADSEDLKDLSKKMDDLKKAFDASKGKKSDEKKEEPKEKKEEPKEKKEESKEKKEEKAKSEETTVPAVSSEDASAGAEYAGELLSEDSDGLEAWYAAWDHDEIGGECSHLGDFVADMEESSEKLASESQDCSTTPCYEHFTNEINKITQRIEEKSHFCHDSLSL